MTIMKKKAKDTKKCSINRFNRNTSIWNKQRLWGTKCINMIKQYENGIKHKRLLNLISLHSDIDKFYSYTKDSYSLKKQNISC